MSRRPHATIAIEWSPRGVTVFDATTGKERQFDDLREAVGLAGQSAIIALSRRTLFVRTVRVPDSDSSTILQILGMRAGELFPVAPGEVALDFMLLSDVNAEGRLALVVAVPTGDLRRIRQEAKEIGLRISRVVPVALGSALVARAVGRTDAAVVSREAGAVGIDIIAGGDLRHSRAVGEGAAVEGEISRTFSVAGLPFGETVSVTGVPGLVGGTESTLTPLEALATRWPDDWRLNLELPEEVEARIRAEARGRMRMAGLMAAGAALLLALVATDYSAKVAEVRRQDERIAKETSRLTKLQKASEAKAATQVGYEKTLVKTFRPAQRLGDVIALVSNRVPQGAWLAGVSVERGKPIVIRGTARNGAAVTAYVQSLIAEPRLRDVKLVFSTNAMLDETPVVQFSVSAFPVGNLPVNEPTTRAKRTASR
ncbi:MAG: PilN domain-containing protein [Fimbriimonas sp.]